MYSDLKRTNLPKECLGAKAKCSYLENLHKISTTAGNNSSENNIAATGAMYNS